MEGMNFKEFLMTKNGRTIMIVVLYIVTLGIAGILMGINGDIAMIYALFFAICGWKALIKIQPAFFIVLPIIGWVIYFIIKFLLSALIGIFVGPYVISKKIISISKNDGETSH